jgi:WD40 repeat protein
MSPDGEAIVTGAGDETLRFWINIEFMWRDLETGERRAFLI